MTRHFATVQGRRVHYSRAGTGPAVLMLHESPCSLKSLEAAQVIVAERFTAIVPDTPGYGLSDPLPLPRPEIADFADALAALLDVLGIGQAAVYGRHTGASIAAEFAHRHPARCVMLLTAGLPVYSSAQQDSRLTEYLRPVVPSWEGAHLLWLWFRYREQHVFWPWHDHRAERRSNEDVPDLEFLHRGVVEFLEAGDGYRLAYAAAFRHGGVALATASALTVPACFGAHEGDSLFRTLSLFPPGTWTAALPRDKAAATRAECELLACHPAPGTVPAAPQPAPIPGRVVADYLDVGGAQVLLRTVGGPGKHLPILLLHHAPGDTSEYEGLMRALGASRCVIAFDLTGCGESQAPPGFVPDIAAWAATAVALLDRLGLAQVHVYGHGGGCAVAAELARCKPGQVGSVILDGVPVLPPGMLPLERDGFASAYAPSAMPEWDGSHLLRVWHHLRDQELWFPWDRRTLDHARAGVPDLEPDDLTRRARACLKQPSTYKACWGAVWAYDLPSVMAELSVPWTVLAENGLPIHRVSGEPEARAGQILALLQS